MHKQRVIDCTFAALVKLVGFGRFARSAAPVCASIVVATMVVHSSRSAHGDAHAAVDVGAWLRPIATAIHASALTEAELVRFESWHQDPLHRDPLELTLINPDAFATEPADAVAPAPALPEPVARPSPQLSSEQHHIVRFIARTHRVALDSAQEFVHYAYKAAHQLKLDPHLILAVMSVESNFNPRAQSHAGAQGLMQVLTRVHVERFEPFGGAAAAFDPFANIHVGSAILKEYLQREGTVPGALKAYVGAALLPSDRGYGEKVLSARKRIAAAALGSAGTEESVRNQPSPPDRVIERTTRAEPRRIAQSGSSEI